MLNLGRSQGDGLVFGRLDGLDGAARHMGRVGIRDDNTDPLVVDWRAPAARRFYTATALDPQGQSRRRETPKFALREFRPWRSVPAGLHAQGTRAIVTSSTLTQAAAYGVIICGRRDQPDLTGGGASPLSERATLIRSGYDAGDSSHGRQK
jgi:hypothetical protein